jgi:hypothetical protein
MMAYSAEDFETLASALEAIRSFHGASDHPGSPAVATVAALRIAANVMKPGVIEEVVMEIMSEDGRVLSDVEMAAAIRRRLTGETG